MYTGLTYTYGIDAFWLFAGGALGLFALIPFTRFLFTSSGSSRQSLYTQSHFIRNKFPGYSGRLASVISTIGMIGFLCINLIVTGKIISALTPIDYTTATAPAALIIYAYIALSGFSAVIKTDVFQFVAVVLILLVFVLFLGADYKPEDIVWAGTQPADLKTILSFFILGICLPFAQPDIWQRLLAMPDVKTAQRAVFSSAVAYIVVGGLLAAISLIIYTEMPDLDPDTAFIFGLKALLPVHMGWLLAVVIFSAIMSTVDTYLYTISSNISQDWIESKASGEEAVSLIRRTAFIVILGALTISIFVTEAVNFAFVFVGLYVALAIGVMTFWLWQAMTAKLLTGFFAFSLFAWAFFTIYPMVTGTLSPKIVLTMLVSSLVAVLVLVISSKVQKRFFS